MTQTCVSMSCNSICPEDKNMKKKIIDEKIKIEKNLPAMSY